MDIQEMYPLQSGEDCKPDPEATGDEERPKRKYPQTARDTCDENNDHVKNSDRKGIQPDGIDVEPPDAVPRQSSRGISAWLPSIGAPAAFLAVIFMSISDIMIKISTGTVNPIQITFFFALAQLMLSTMCAVLHSLRNESILRRRYTRLEWIYLLICGTLSGGGRILLVAAYNLMPVGDAVTVLRSMPVFAAIIGWIFLKQALRVVDFLYIALCISGVVLVVRPTFLFPGEEDEFGTERILGTGFTLASAIFFAVAFSLGKKTSESKIQPYIVIIVTSCMTVLLISIVWAFDRKWDCVDPRTMLFILAGGALTSAAHVLIFWALSREKVVVVTVILATNVIAVYLLQIVVLHVIPLWLSGVGAVLVLTACIGMSIRRDDPRPDRRAAPARSGSCELGSESGGETKEKLEPDSKGESAE